MVELSLQSQSPLGDATGVAVEGAVEATAAVQGARVARTAVGGAGPPLVLTVALPPPPGRALCALQDAAATSRPQARTRTRKHWRLQTACSNKC